MRVFQLFVNYLNEKLLHDAVFTEHKLTVGCAERVNSINITCLLEEPV